MTLRKFLALVGAFSLGVGVTQAAQGDEYQYQPKSFFGGGYTDEVMAPGRWKTRGFYTTARLLPHFPAPQVLQDNALDKALYRAALHAKAENYPYMQIVQAMLIRKMRYWSVPVAEDVFFVAIGVRSADSPIACEERNAKLRTWCRNFNVAAVLREIGPKLGRTQELMIADVEEVRSKLKTAPSLTQPGGEAAQDMMTNDPAASPPIAPSLNLEKIIQRTAEVMPRPFTLNDGVVIDGFAASGDTLVVTTHQPVLDDPGKTALLQAICRTRVLFQIIAQGGSVSSQYLNSSGKPVTALTLTPHACGL